jgi:hypothetical protein
MNIFLLLKVAEAILAEPWHFNMDSWDCGTTACIGGWACRLSGMPYHETRQLWHYTYPKKFLKLSGEEAERLFFDENWPEQFRFSFDNLRDIDGHIENHEKAVQIAVARIHHFIATEGRE